MIYNGMSCFFWAWYTLSGQDWFTFGKYFHKDWNLLRLGVKTCGTLRIQIGCTDTRINKNYHYAFLCLLTHQGNTHVFMLSLRLSVQENLHRWKIHRLRIIFFPFWNVVMGVSNLCVRYKWQLMPLSLSGWVLNFTTDFNSEIPVWDKYSFSDYSIKDHDGLYYQYSSTWSCAAIWL